MSLDQNWFSEISNRDSTAFSLQGKRLHNETTPFQTIDIYHTEGMGNLMVIDGCIMLTQRDNFLYHEMMTHPALHIHPHPRRVVIIGGGDCGSLREVLKHECVESVWQIDIDERVTRLAEKYFPELCDRNDDPRATLYFGDGIKWVSDTEPNSVDLLIIDSTDPIGPAEGLFSKSFYETAKRALKADGLIVQQSESPLYHQDILQRMYRDMRAAGMADIKTLFYPQPVYPSGWWSATLASKSGLIQARRPRPVNQDALQTRYYSEDIHKAAFAMPPFMKAVLAKI